MQIHYSTERPWKRSSSNHTGLVLAAMAPQHPNLSPDQAAQLPHGAAVTTCTWLWGVSTGPAPRAPHCWMQGILWGASSHRAGRLTSPTGGKQVGNLHCWGGMLVTSGWGAEELWGEH